MRIPARRCCSSASRPRASPRFSAAACRQADRPRAVLRLSVLDQSPIRAGGTAADAVAETLELAQACDRWGYHRYWLAEHHASRGLAGSTPEVLIAHIAAHTCHLRVGSGGVMLSHYS